MFSSSSMKSVCLNTDKLLDGLLSLEASGVQTHPPWWCSLLLMKSCPFLTWNHFIVFHNDISGHWLPPPLIQSNWGQNPLSAALEGSGDFWVLASLILVAVMTVSISEVYSLFLLLTRLWAPHKNLAASNILLLTRIFANNLDSQVKHIFYVMHRNKQWEYVGTPRDSFLPLYNCIKRCIVHGTNSSAVWHVCQLEVCDTRAHHEAVRRAMQWWQSDSDWCISPWYCTI